jgi:hypothetical protein
VYTQLANVDAGSELNVHGRHSASVNSRTLKASCAFTKVQGDDDDPNKWQRITAIGHNILMK